MKKKFFFSFFIFFIFPLCTFIQISNVSLASQSDWTIKDENLEMFIELDGINIIDAVEKSNALLIDPDGVVQGSAKSMVVSDNPIQLEKIKIVFVWADLDAFSHTTILDVTIYPGSGGLIVDQTLKFKDYLGYGDIQFISGIYQLRYDLYYSVEDHSKVLKGVPFYVKITGNPIVTVSGVVATAFVAYAGISTLGLVNSIKKTIQLEVDRSIESTKISPTEKLIGYYKGKSVKNLQNEISKITFGYATRLLRGDKCPQCGVDWPEGREECMSCQITLEDAQKLYSKSLRGKSLDASKEVVDSVSGLSLSGIAHKLGEGVTPTSDIISVLIYSGLALVQPRVAKSWGTKTRKLIFAGLRTSVFSLFWIQACGIEAISLSMLVTAILTGIILPILFSKVLGNNIKAKAGNYWKSKQSSLRLNP